jgi:acetyltransferase-like isoleucine patch superfamily enzyme
MQPNVISALKEHHVSFMGRPDSNQINGWNTPIAFEPFVQMRGGRYDIGRVGAFSYFGGRDSQVRFVSSVGRFCSIAQGLIAGPTEHTMAMVSSHSFLTGSFNKTWPELFSDFGISSDQIEFAKTFANETAMRANKRIQIGNDVWIGEGAFIGRGVTIGDGAVIAARATVVRDVPPYAIVGGTPARIIRMRFPDGVIERLLNSKWWLYGPSILAGINWSDLEASLDAIEERIAGGVDQWHPDLLQVRPDGKTEIIKQDC